MRRLLIGDRRVRVRDEGESKKSPLVLIHGAGGSSVTWMNLVRRLAPLRRVVAPDLPGHGQSDPWHGCSIDGYRDAVGTIAAKLGLEKVILVGHSMGGAIALGCALAWPARVAGLILVGTGARLPVAPSVFDMLEKDFAHYPEWLRQVGYSPSTPREVVDPCLAVAVAAPQEVVLGDFRACSTFDVRPQLPSLKMPALVLAGADDLLTPPKLTHELTAGLGNARSTLLPHAGHFVHHEQPIAVHDAISAFLTEVP